VPWAEAEAATVEAHDALSSGLVEDAGRQADAQELLESDLQIGLALRRKQRMKGAHLAFVVCSTANLVGGAARKLAIRGHAVAQRGESGSRVGFVLSAFGLAVIAPRHERAEGEKRETHAACLAAHGVDGRMGVATRGPSQ